MLNLRFCRQLPVSLPSGIIGAALFRTISDVARATDSRRTQPTEPTATRQPRSVRVRMGRGGRCFVDRRLTGRRNSSGPPPPIPALPTDLNKTYMEHFAKRVNVFSVNEDSEPPKSPSKMGVESFRQGEHAEYTRRLEERWRFDSVDEADDDERRVLIDDFEPRYSVKAVSLPALRDLHFTIEDTLPHASPRSLRQILLSSPSTNHISLRPARILYRRKLQPSEPYRLHATKSSKRVWSNKPRRNRWPLPAPRRKLKHVPQLLLPASLQRPSLVSHPPPPIPTQFRLLRMRRPVYNSKPLLTQVHPLPLLSHQLPISRANRNPHRRLQLL